MSKVVIADFGTGNLHSVINAIEKVADTADVIPTHHPRQIRSADRLVLPGQGAIGTWMKELRNDEVRMAVELAVKTKPVLGICLGLQALYTHSDEDGGVNGLGFLSGHVRKFDSQLMDAGRRIKIPHMGWSKVHQTAEHPLWEGIPQDTRFYFVHSYCAQAGNQSEVSATATYGMQFVCAAAKENLFAVQFHPEKSRQQGLRLLANFIDWNGSR
ncbi:MAG: imidazole glycerol phosphate synthase subunit HisH [Acidiferrobacterales bacterium]|nr:imidazole glycerol phosphate synthase subunit HisH [Acidiferrobacterales bacterium]